MYLHACVHTHTNTCNLFSPRKTEYYRAVSLFLTSVTLYGIRALSSVVECFLLCTKSDSICKIFKNSGRRSLKCANLCLLHLVGRLWGLTYFCTCGALPFKLLALLITEV